MHTLWVLGSEVSPSAPESKPAAVKVAAFPKESDLGPVLIEAHAPETG